MAPTYLFFPRLFLNQVLPARLANPAVTSPSSLRPTSLRKATLMIAPCSGSPPNGNAFENLELLYTPPHLVCRPPRRRRTGDRPVVGDSDEALGKVKNRVSTCTIYYCGHQSRVRRGMKTDGSGCETLVIRFIVFSVGRDPALMRAG